MKRSLLLLIILTLGLGSCTPLDHSDDGDRDRDRDSREDTARGETRWEIPDIQTLEDPRSVRAGLDQESCSDYSNTVHVSALGKISPARPIANCIAYNIDKGLKPLCELERDARDILDETDDRDDRDALDEYLVIVEEEKDIFLDYIYEISDIFYDTCGDIDDYLDNEYKSWEDPTDKTFERMGKRFLQLGLEVSVSGECKSLYRSIDYKARIACRGLNISTILKRR